mgnify:CR=1 FL=1
MRRAHRLAAGALLLGSSAMASAPETDPANPTCPKQLNWSTYRTMRFTLEDSGGIRALKAEGLVDEGVPERLREALEANAPIDEIWVRSPGGDARAGNAAGKVIREAGIPTRIPAGWACFSACNFVFMGGPIRFVDPGGQFVVHMFTHIGDKEAVRREIERDAEGAVALIGEVEQDSAMLASEDNDFLIRMGISRKLLTEVMYRQKAVSSAADGPLPATSPNVKPKCPSARLK